ncbi:portal protein [Gordonia phage Coeur]|uniref:Portal protein n=1 Tax=Gordonia phage Coeur TaxID=2571246 RepID=A0A4Y6EFZ6_9CAUD|nr:portal protein [Gordonia phage Coeur]QDF17422.1 portal protein [Gordonia phage Coeur]
MSFLSRLRAALAVPAVAAGEVRRLSPYDDINHLSSFVAPDWLPAHGVTREAAMSVPAVARARRIICSSIASLPLRAYRGDQLAETQPPWLDRTDGPVSPYHRMLWTVDDLLFYGWSAWAVARNSAGVVIAADRIPFDSWHIDAEGHIVYRARAQDGDPTDVIAADGEVVLIPGADQGLLVESATAIRHALALLQAAAKASANPAAYIELHQTNDLPITEAERTRLVDAWVSARRGENGGVAFTSAGIEAREHGTFDAHLLVEGRNAAALDIARAVGLPGSVLDATVDKSSLNYENAQSKARDLIDYGLAAYMSPISARLGLDDVVPRGTSIRFDIEAVIGPRATAGTPDDGGASTPPADPPAQGGGAS